MECLLFRQVLCTSGPRFDRFQLQFHTVVSVVPLTMCFELIRERERNVLFNDALNTFYLRLYGGEREMFYLTTHSTHFIYGYMASDIWLRTIRIVGKETCCRYIGYSYRLTARVLLYAPSHRQDNTYHGLCYICRGALAGTRNSSMGLS